MAAPVRQRVAEPCAGGEAKQAEHLGHGEDAAFFACAAAATPFGLPWNGPRCFRLES